MISAVAPRDSERAAELEEGYLLPGGRYLVKVYIDRADRTKADRDYAISEREFFAELETDGDWPPGYQPPKIIETPVRD